MNGNPYEKGPYMGEGRFRKELERRTEDGYEATEALLSQERAFIQPDVCFVDLPALRYEGTFPEEQKAVTTERFELADFMQGLIHQRYLENLKKQI